MQGLCLFRLSVRDLAGGRFNTFKNLLLISSRSKLHRYCQMRAMASNDPTEIPLDELEAAKAGEHWGPQRMTHGRRDVITAFVRRPSDSSILFVKRSEKVNTYKLHWGGVSGVVEGNENLRERAEREVCLFSSCC
jgi:hypothetical protein